MLLPESCVISQLEIAIDLGLISDVRTTFLITINQDAIEFMSIARSSVVYHDYEAVAECRWSVEGQILQYSPHGLLIVHMFCK